MESELTHAVTLLVGQLAVILVVAKLCGEVFERYLRQPGVLGELIGGVIIGPHLLGGVPLFGLGPLFPSPLESSSQGAASIPISPELYAVAQVAAVVLLFMAGLETDLQQFFRYGGAAVLVAVGGVALPFFLGAAISVGFGISSSLIDPSALFVGAILTATSVGITARVLGDLRRLATPEGVTILAAAVIDDVLGILVMTVVVGLGVGGSVTATEVGLVAVKAIGFWLTLTLGGILLSRRISDLLSSLRSDGASLAMAVAMAFGAAALAQAFGLALIIGAYSVGLALSTTKIAEDLERPLGGLYQVLVPVFFVVMGMLVDLRAMQGVLAFGLVVTLLAIVGKIAGCGLPALLVGFNGYGALRVGLGMLPRGEVALIVAGVGLSSGVITGSLFGVAVMMTLVTTLLAPLLLVPAFRLGGEGTRRPGAGQTIASGPAGGHRLMQNS